MRLRSTGRIVWEIAFQLNLICCNGEIGKGPSHRAQRVPWFLRPRSGLPKFQVRSTFPQAIVIAFPEM